MWLRQTQWMLVGLAGLGLASCYVPPDDGRATGPQSPSEEEAAADEQGASPDNRWWDGSDEERAPTEEPGARRGESAAGLAHQAREAYDGRDYSTAVDYLEQALQMEPEEAVLWQNLAAVRLQQGRNQRAEELALRAVNLGENDLEVVREAWWLVAAARMERGDRRGAREAAETARRFGETGEGAGGGRMP